MTSNQGGIYRVGDEVYFFRIFSGFFGALTVKMTSFSIEAVKFIFKRINHTPPHRYRPAAPATAARASGSAWDGPNTSATACPCQPAMLSPSLLHGGWLGSTAQRAYTTTSGAGSSTRR
jgi:hypothetical protein